MSYNELRHLADSIGLLLLVLSFISFIGWTFRPGARQHHHDAAHMIFDKDDDNGRA